LDAAFQSEAVCHQRNGSREGEEAEIFRSTRGLTRAEGEFSKMSVKNASCITGASLLAILVAQSASAQEKPQPLQAAQQRDGGTVAEAAPSDDIVVTGTRTTGRSRLDTASPIDVVSNSALQRQATSEVGTALANVVPSIVFPRPAATAGSDSIRPAALRGLSPDQTLVLINGTRAHASALVNVFGTVGRGSAAVDLNTVPTAAIESIEVLRDGAAAQYGSDAIAGVVNMRLRQARSGGAATVDYGFYDTQVETANGSRHVTGEPALTASIWQGIGFGEDGFLTVTGEYQRRKPTSRGDFDPNVRPARVDSRFGDPDVEQYTGYANFGKGLIGSWQLYGWLGYQYRDSESALLPVLATTAAANGVGSIYPNGFLPLIQVKSRDFNSALGVRGEVDGWNVDTKVSYGRNALSFRTNNSANYTYGAASQTSFFAGTTTYDQLLAGLDVSKKLDLLGGLNVAFGLEGRRESFQIGAGEPSSYNYGPASTARPPGARAFPGFAPENAVDKNRWSGSVYLDLEAQLTDKLLLGVAGRAERYSDFGSTVNGKASARYDFASWFALRGTASTGFRAPSLQQSYYTSISSLLITGTPVALLTGTYPATSGVSESLGARPLRPEKSTNLSVGTVIRAGKLDLTIDAYSIRVRDQISLSENLTAASNPLIAAVLAPYRVAAARFFINGLASTTKGIDAVAHYRLKTEKVGVFDLTLAANVNKVDVTRIPSIPLATGTALFARSRIVSIEEGTPGEKVTGSVDWTGGGLGLTARATYYGSVNYPGLRPSLDALTGQRVVTDLEARYERGNGLRLAVGASNLFDVYPRAVPLALNPTGVAAFPNYSPFGFNGRFLYVRAGVGW
jgi:iron complex outermembrane receptor protein